MAYPWEPFSVKALESIEQSTKRLNFWEGSVRSGKTVSSLCRWIEYIVTGPPGDLLMIGKTERTLKRNVLDPLSDMVGEANFRYNRGTGECYVFNRRIYIIGASDARSEGKIRGMTVAGAYGDEVTLWPEEMFKQLLARMSVKGAMFFGTTNPDSPSHWLYINYLLRIIEGELTNGIVFSFCLDDNDTLDPDYVSALKLEYTGLWYKRFIDGLWVVAEGSIYAEQWDEEKNTYISSDRPERIFQDFRRYIPMDYGTTNPMVFLDCYYDGRTIWIDNEYYYDSKVKMAQKTDGQYADALEEFIKEQGEQFPRELLDPSAASFKAELRKRGHRVTEADNNVLDGIRMVASMIANGVIKVNKDKCPNFLKEIGAYVWDDKARLNGEDKPLKQNDHAMDAIRYLVNTFISPRRI